MRLLKHPFLSPFRFLLVPLFLLTPLGCTVDGWNDGTSIQFEETTNIGYRCGQGLAFEWNVRARETGEEATAGCQQPIRFEGLYDGSTYTFDITGYIGSEVCWSGTCSVRAYGGTRTDADCSAQIRSFCSL